MSERSELARGRAAYSARAWGDAYRLLSDADGMAPLGSDDLWRLAMAAQLVGRDDRFLAVLERAHHAQLEAGATLPAARSAFWMGLHLAERGETGPATGWLGRAARLVQSEGRDCAERGYLLLPAAHQKFSAHEYQTAYDTAGEAVAIAQRFGENDLLALALHVCGRARVRQARVGEGLALLDEAMVAVTSDELSPHVTGLIYCSVIAACRDVCELRRAREWTAALAHWCEQQPDLEPFRGQCRVYRAEIMLLRGAWKESIEEAQRASQQVTAGPEAAVAAAAFYQHGEAHRLLGEFVVAEASYARASQLGHEPQPGLALLRLAQGDQGTAAATLRRLLGETDESLRRARILPAYVEVVLALGEVQEAERACEELAGIAHSVGSEFLEATVAYARGAIALARGDPRSALVLLRRASQEWRALEAPYEIARSRVLIAAACRELGDDDSAALELEAARVAFAALGAPTALARAQGVREESDTARRSDGLTPRERQVLVLVTTGKTNRAIGEALFISEKTVARHVSNILSKLGLPSRAAATAYAYEHDLTKPTP